VDGQHIGRGKITRADAPFEFDFALPDSLAGKETIQIQLETDRVFVAPRDGRALGALFGAFTIR
jgi:hypothetical protein